MKTMKTKFKEYIKEEYKNDPVEMHISDDLKSNFRDWEMGDSSDYESTRELALALMSRHPVYSYEECFDYAKNWTGYEEKNDE